MWPLYWIDADFNPRPRAEGGNLPHPQAPQGGNFNPRPRAEGGQPASNAYAIPLYISTHALVQRAAYTACRVYGGMLISTHALVQRAAVGRGAFDHPGTFQPTPSCRGRLGQLTRGRGSNPHFNPRPRAEGGFPLCWRLHPCQHFNPRPRAEGGE